MYVISYLEVYSISTLKCSISEQNFTCPSFTFVTVINHENNSIQEKSEYAPRHIQPRHIANNNLSNKRFVKMSAILIHCLYLRLVGCIEFNTTLTGHIIAVGNAHVFPGFLTPVLTQLSFQSHKLLFSHASAEVRGENTSERKFTSTGDQTHNHQVMSPTRSPLRHRGGASLPQNHLYSYRHHPEILACEVVIPL